MKAAHSIQILCGTYDKPEKYEITPDVIAGEFFAIHSFLRKDKTFDNSIFMITHIPTGMVFPIIFPNRTMALRFIKFLLTLPIDYAIMRTIFPYEYRKVVYAKMAECKGERL